MIRFRCLFVASVMFVFPLLARGEVKLPPVFSEHMVLQRDLAAPIWGTAAPGEEVSIAIAEQSQITKADDQGQWRIKLKPLAAGGPHSLTVKGKNTIEFKDVLVGEVWLGSGQSNMAGKVSGYAKNDPVLAELAKGSYPQLRLLQTNSPKGWREATPEANNDFSAILFAFAVRLQQELDCPVGVMVGAVGGTPSGFWLTEEMLRDDAAAQTSIREATAKYDPAKEKAQYEKDVEKWKAEVAKAETEKKKKPNAPSQPAPPGQCARGKIGNLFEAHIRPVVSYGMRGVLWDQGESGTAITSLDQFVTMGALISGWRKAWGQGEFPFLYIQKPSGSGCAWDDSDPVTAKAEKFSALPPKVPAQGDGLYRELHIRIAQHPQTHMVTCSDLGSGIHPSNKSGYGTRAARTALGAVYAKPIISSGPTYVSHRIEGNQIIIKFANVGKGLAARHAEKLQGFAIAGENKAFVWAEAKIAGDEIIVSSAEIAAPQAVRYAWHGQHPWANLFNQDGLPAQTFRTDRW